MELRHLRYFVAVAEELHFSRAAAKLNIATPTLSSQIQALEALLGARLFVRKTRSVALTHVGKRFLEEARTALKQVERAELVGRSAAKGETGSIAIGYILTAGCGDFFAPSIVDFRKLHPDVSVQFRRMQTIPQMKALIEGSLDVGFARAPDRFPAGLAGFTIERQPLFIALPDDHRLASNERIEPEMLAGEAVVTTLLEMEMGYWSNISAIMPPDMSVRVVARVADSFSVLLSVAAGVGMGIIPESLTRIPMRGVVCRKVAGVAPTSDHVAVFRQNESAPLVKSFIALLRAKTRDLQSAA
ncbi:MAG TPA: LysR substrate-binding domain-containing protein [Xanthobacteraceae bacterium]